MSVRRVIFALVTLCVLSMRSTLGQFNRCNSQQSCVEFARCPEFTLFANEPPSSWPLSVRNEVKNRLCKVEKRGQKKIYHTCCNHMNTNTPKGLDLVNTNTPKGLDLLNFTDCGRSTKDRVAGGKSAKVFEYPWMALLLDDAGQIRCGGTLIAAKYVLTAAHCDRPPIATVRLGENDISKPIDCNVFKDEEDCADPPQNIPVADFIKHPLHSVSKRKNDIALIRLSRAARLSYSVTTICLPVVPEFQLHNPANMIVSGWGYTQHGRISNVLQYAKMPVVDNTRCLRILSNLDNSISLDESQFCAGGKDKVDNCSGDSGGPLQYHNERSVYIQYGIVSYGIDSCGIDTVPGVYTKVSHYTDWILKNLK